MGKRMGIFGKIEGEFESGSLKYDLNENNWGFFFLVFLFKILVLVCQWGKKWALGYLKGWKEDQINYVIFKDKLYSLQLKVVPTEWNEWPILRIFPIRSIQNIALKNSWEMYLKCFLFKILFLFYFCLAVFLFSDRLINLAADFCKILVFWISNWIGYSNI